MFLLILYLQMLPKLANGDANKVFVTLSELTEGLSQLGHAVSGRNSVAHAADGPPPPPPRWGEVPGQAAGWTH